MDNDQIVGFSVTLAVFTFCRQISSTHRYRTDKTHAGGIFTQSSENQPPHPIHQNRVLRGIIRVIESSFFLCLKRRVIRNQNKRPHVTDYTCKKGASFSVAVIGTKLI